MATRGSPRHEYSWSRHEKAELRVRFPSVNNNPHAFPLIENLMYIVEAAATPTSELETFYIDTNDISQVSNYIQRKMGQWYEVISVDRVEGICISADD